MNIAYEKGKKARIMGEGENSNPYKTANKRAEWIRGYTFRDAPPVKRRSLGPAEIAVFADSNSKDGVNEIRLSLDVAEKIFATSLQLNADDIPVREASRQLLDATRRAKELHGIPWKPISI
jgi:ribosome modulation factor